MPDRRHSEVLLHFQLCENVTKKTLMDVLIANVSLLLFRILVILFFFFFFKRYTELGTPYM